MAIFVSGLASEALDRFAQYWLEPQCAVEEHADARLL